MLRTSFRRSCARRTVSPSTHPRPASGGATDFLPASALSKSPTCLAASRRRRRAMRLTDFCHPYELRAPAPRAFPARSRRLRGAESPRRLRLRAAVTGGPDASRRPRPLRRIVVRRWYSSSLQPRVTSVGVLFPRRRRDRASDTPVAISCVHPRASPGFPGAAIWPCASPVGLEHGSEDAEAAETTVDATS